jgi:hypothetical protein
MAARIYQHIKNNMQSGKARTGQWILEFEPAEPRQADPLTGWTGSGDTRDQIKLSFDTLDAARAYAAANGLDARVIPANPSQLKLKTYADNFSVGPVIPVGDD